MERLHGQMNEDNNRTYMDAGACIYMLDQEDGGKLQVKAEEAVHLASSNNQA